MTLMMVSMMVSMMASVMVTVMVSMMVACLLVVSMVISMVISMMISMMMTNPIPFSKSIRVVEISLIIKPIKTIRRSGCIVRWSRGGAIGIRGWGVIGGFRGVVGGLGRIIRRSGWCAI